jgi:hypothetical protein
MQANRGEIEEKCIQKEDCRQGGLSYRRIARSRSELHEVCRQCEMSYKKKAGNGMRTSCSEGRDTGGMQGTERVHEAIVDR